MTIYSFFFVSIFWLGFFFECSNGGGIIGKVPKNIGESSSSQGPTSDNKASGDSSEVPLKFIQNEWDYEFCHEKLKVKELEGGKQKQTISFFKSFNTFRGYSVFAKYPISLNNNSNGIFYLEITVKKMESFFYFGFAQKQKDKLEIQYYTEYMEKHTYAYLGSDYFIINGSKVKGYNWHSLKEGDIVGFGVNLDTREIFFTKNGQKVSSHFVDNSSDVHQLYPFVTLMKDGDEIETNFGPNFNYKLPIGKFLIKTCEIFLHGEEITKQENFWESFLGGLKITGDKSLNVQNKKESHGWQFVFAKHSISPNNNNSSDIFYYEIIVKNFEGCILFGFADKKLKNELFQKFFRLKGTYAYDSAGYFFINGNVTVDEYKFGVGDVVGCGVNLATRQIIFTKNGCPIVESSGFFLAPSSAVDQLFPFVALFDNGDEITANFGSEEFKFIRTLSEQEMFTETD